MEHEEDRTVSAQQEAASERNQCDGCMRGAALRGGLHIDGEGHAFMSCTRDRYAAPGVTADTMGDGELYGALITISKELHALEAEGVDLSDEADDAWALITDWILAHEARYAP